MTDEERDPTLHAFFARSTEELAAGPFTDQVMAKTEKLQRKVLIGRISVGMVAALLALAFQDLALLLTQIPLLVVESELLAQILAPINHLGAIVSLLLIGLRIAYRKIFQ